MTLPNNPFSMIPPVMTVRVEESLDIMIVRDTARRAAGLVGFSPAERAQLSSAAATLAELILKTGDPHVIRMNGTTDGRRRGLQISLQTPWLAGHSANNVLLALRNKMGELVDEIQLTAEEEPTIIMIMWLREDSNTRATQINPNIS